MPAAVLLIALTIASSPDLGVAAGTCRPNEAGPSIRIAVTGLIDRKGTLRAELYPDDDNGFLQDDNVLVGAGRTFRRVVARIPAAGPVALCLRAPQPGTYTLSLIHNRSGGHGFNLLHDGAGFPGNPRLGLSRPHAAQARIAVGAGPTPATIRMNYRHGLFGFGPLPAGGD